MRKFPYSIDIWLGSLDAFPPSKISAQKYVRDVLLLRTEAKMFWVAAPWVVAGVQHLHAVWYFLAVPDLPCEAMGAHKFAIENQGEIDHSLV